MINAAIERPHGLAAWLYVNPDNPEEGLRPEIVSRLETIVERVKALLPDLPGLDPLDVWLVGSITGYEFSPHSDIDLHFIIDQEDLARRHNMSPEQMKNLLKYTFSYINERGVFDVEGYPVELYWQDKKEVNKTPAVYSLERKKLIRVPHKTQFPEEVVQKAELKAADLDDELGTLISEGNREKVQEWREYVKALREKAIQKEGPESFGNFVFKDLRNRGALDRAADFMVRL